MTLLHGDCVDVMRAMPAGSVDAVVCDPPYGLNFMGAKWDAPDVAFRANTWHAVLWVLKPGGHLLAFGGTRTYHRMVCAIEDAGFEVRDCLAWMYGTGLPKSHNGPWGGTALKPAHEPIVLARKPLVGTVAGNVQTHGTGALNVDACRVSAADAHTTGRANSGAKGNGGVFGASDTYDSAAHSAGRWPANVLLDESAAAALDAQSGVSTSSDRPRRNSAAAHNRTASMGKSAADWTTSGHADTGGASRFYYVAKPSRREKGESNTHPTVKPLALMRWLVRLVTPPGGLVLDPFAGSGTTLLAARAEGFRFIGIEESAEYVEMARRRLAEAQKQGEIPLARAAP